MKLKLTLVSFVTMVCVTVNAQKHEIQSPDGHLKVSIDIENGLKWNISHDNTTVIAPSEIAVNGEPLKVKSVKRSKAVIKRSFATPFYKKAMVDDEYREMTLKGKGLFDVVVRAYDDGAAYRLVYKGRKPYIVKSETADFNFNKDYKTFVPYVNDNRGGERYCYSFESYYDEAKMSQMYDDSLSITPLMVCIDNGKKAVVMEAGVENYPGLFLTKNAVNGNGLVAEFAPVPKKEVIGGHARLNIVPTERHDYIATLGSNQALPWRVVLVATDDAQLLNNDMAQRLAPECRIADTSWIRPGKVAWDWWNTCNVTGVDFKAGMNTATYKYYIDFAAINNLEYIIIDEGWSGGESLMENINPDINLQEIIDYGKRRGIGVILWASWRNAKNNTDEVFAHYAAMGVKGFKVDFFDRDDQLLIRSAYDMAAVAAMHHLLLDFHGMKPCGIQRAYPNIVNFEGVKGLENNKWEPIVDGRPLHDMPRYDVTAPYLRQLAGPMDYTPGGLRNAMPNVYRPVNDHPMTQGTRAHQVAMYVLFEAPLQMLADSPTQYMKEQETTDFIAQIPTVFDETVAIGGEIGEYAAVARRKGDVWYLSAMTNWNARTVNLPLTFLGDGEWTAEVFEDGINAERDATDYKLHVFELNKSAVLSADMKSGGGCAAIFKKK